MLQVWLLIITLSSNNIKLYFKQKKKTKKKKNEKSNTQKLKNALSIGVHKKWNQMIYIEQEL